MFKNLFLGILFCILIIPGSAQQEIPERIISLAPSLTKNLGLLDSEGLLVGCTNYCSLQTNMEAEIVANAVQVNMEKIVLLQPDLVITTNLTKTRTIENIRKLGINLVVFNNPTDFEEICTQFIELGILVGKKEIAEDIISKVRERIEKVTTYIPEDYSSDTRVFMQLGAKPLFSVVPGSFMNDYIELSGTSNLFEDLSMGGINLETVLVRDPEVIIIVLMGMVGSEEKKRWESFPQLSAVRDERIYLLDADKACSPTPLSFVESLEAVIRMIYRGEEQVIQSKQEHIEK